MAPTADSSDTKFRTLFDVLLGDVRESLDNFIHNSESPFLRRVYIRSIFAFIEAMVYRMKQAALLRAVGGNPAGTAAEIALLREETYDLDGKGEARARPKFLKAIGNLKFAVKMYSRYYNANYAFQARGKGWDDFVLAVAIRNRLTHPKTDTDVHVSDADLLTVQNAYEWFKQLTIELLPLPPA